jgi:hypothetical protein
MVLMAGGTDWLDEIEKRAMRATPGPWSSFIEGRDHTSGSSFIRTAGEDIELAGATVDDQDFIAHARTDIPTLVAEVRRLLNERGADGTT